MLLFITYSPNGCSVLSFQYTVIICPYHLSYKEKYCIQKCKNITPGIYPQSDILSNFFILLFTVISIN